MSDEFLHPKNQTGVAHHHREYVAGCFRCDLSRQESLQSQNQALQERAADEQALADKALASLDRMQERAEKAEAALQPALGFVSALQERAYRAEAEVVRLRRVLEVLAHQDWRGNKPLHVTIAENALYPPPRRLTERWRSSFQTATPRASDEAHPGD